MGALFVFLLIFIFIGLIPANIASNKGRSFGGWWVYGSLFFIVALVHSLLIKSDEKTIERKKLEEGSKKCPFCAEIIKPEAIVCRYCGKDLPKEEAKSMTPNYGNLSASLAGTAAHIDERELEMEALGITFDGKQYAFRESRYDKLADAVAYAEKQRNI